MTTDEAATLALLFERLVDDHDLLEAIAAAIPLGATGGWVVAWESPVDLVPEAAAHLGLGAPMAEGVNARYVTTREELCDLVVDAADVGTYATVVDVESLW